jgi:hypothetical protein
MWLHWPIMICSLYMVTVKKVLYDTKLGNLKFHDNLFVVLYCSIYKMDLFCYTWLQSGIWHGTCSVIRGYSQEFDMGLVLLYVVTVRNLTWDLFCYTWLQSGIWHGTCSVIRGYSQEFDMGLVLLYVVTFRSNSWL